LHHYQVVEINIIFCHTGLGQACTTQKVWRAKLSTQDCHGLQ